MSRSLVVRRLALAVCLTTTAGLGACSGGIDRSEYTSPIAATAAPPPVVPIAAADAGTVRSGRLPLLPPVPEEQTGLPPVTIAQLVPPPVY